MSNPVRNVKTMVVRELYAYFATPIAYVFLVIFLALAGWFTFQMGQFFEAGVASLRGSFFPWHPWLFMIFVPAVGMRMWAEERRSGAIELLLTMPTTVTQAVLAKFIAGGLFLVLALLLTLPMVGTVMWLGDPDPGEMFAGYLGSGLVALSFLAVSSLTSAMTRNQIVSFIVSLVVCLLLILCGFPPVLDIMRDWGAASWAVSLVSEFSITTHYESMQRGVLDTRDFLYFGSLIVFGLFGTGLLLNKD